MTAVERFAVNLPTRQVLRYTFRESDYGDHEDCYFANCPWDPPRLIWRTTGGPYTLYTDLMNSSSVVVVSLTYGPEVSLPRCLVYHHWR